MALERLFSSEELLKLELSRKPPETVDEILADIHTSDSIRDSAAPYGAAAPAEPLHTIRDYLALPDDQRVELIDGVFYDMASPSRLHQAILGHLHVQLYACTESHPECELFLSPSDVRLNSDDYTVVQPDLYVICSQNEQEKFPVCGNTGSLILNI